MIIADDLPSTFQHSVRRAFMRVYPEGIDPNSWDLEAQLHMLTQTPLRLVFSRLLVSLGLKRHSFEGLNFADMGTDVDMDGYVQRRPLSLSGSDLDGCDFAYANLSGVQLARASCIGTDFRGADLTNVNGFRTDFSRANFSRADLMGSMLDESLCRSTYFVGAQCNGADFVGACLAGANFSQANLIDADFRFADLTGAAFRDAKGDVPDAT